MKVDFWQFSQGSVPQIVAQIAERVRAQGDRLLVVDRDTERRTAISQALWDAKPAAFLANGDSADPHSDCQPILLSDTCEAPNQATVAVLADGEWRDAGERFGRTILLFGGEQVEAARAVWRRFDGRDEIERGYFAQEDGRWVKKA